MKYNQLGRTGLLVSEITLGTMTFGGKGMFAAIGSLQQDMVDQMMKKSIDAGVNFIDTANVYSVGLSEQFTGQALQNLGIARKDVVISTKALGPMGKGPNDTGASRKHLLTSIDESLDRLGTDYVDLYLIHGWDPITPVEETLRALDTIVTSGRARYVGVSNWAAWHMAKAMGISERLGLARIEAVQSYYSLAGRELEREIVPMLKSEKLGLMVWSPLAGGYLSGKYSDGKKDGRRAEFNFPPVDYPQADATVDAMRPIAKKHGCSVAQVALAWLLHQDAVSTVVIGANTLDQLDSNLAAVNVSLDPDDLGSLDAVSRLKPEYPGWMIERQGEYRQGSDAGSPPGKS